MTKVAVIVYTVDRYIGHLREKRPSVFESIQSISRLTGKACRDQVALVVTTFSSQDNRTHDSVIYAIILSIIGKTDEWFFIIVGLADYW